MRLLGQLHRYPCLLTLAGEVRLPFIELTGHFIVRNRVFRFELFDFYLLLEQSIFVLLDESLSQKVVVAESKLPKHNGILC